MNVRLAFRPPAQAAADIEPHDGPLGVAPGSGRDGVLYVPETAARNAPVLLFFHGAGGTGRRELRAVVAAADEYGAVVVAPDSRGPTWDIIHQRDFGPDVEFADRALDAVAKRVDVDFSRLGIGGISDGASYALSIGLCNGDLFGSVIAFSAGFVVPPEPVGMPRVFLSHGTRDQILPIDGCGRSIAAGLGGAGYDVTFLEFDGGHTVPPPVAERGFAWWLTGSARPVPAEPAAGDAVP